MTSCLKRSLTVLHNFSRSTQVRKIALSVTSRNLAVPQPDGQPKVFSPKIKEIADSIAQLNLIEVAELSDLLKEKLNLPDAPAISFAGVAAPAAAAAAPDEEESQSTQTLFSVKLKGFDEKQKVALIKEIKNLMEGMNLVQAKKFVESAPTLVKQDLGKTEAENIKEALTKVGADVEII